MEAAMLLVDSAVEREGVNIGRQAFREIAAQSWLLTLVEIRSQLKVSLCLRQQPDSHFERSLNRCLAASQS